MSIETLELGVQRRAFKPDKSTFDKENLTIDSVWSTGAAVKRFDWNRGTPYWEKLSMDPAHVRMGFLSSGTAPILDDHNNDGIRNQVGVIDRAAIVDGQGTATLRFSKRASNQELVQDIQDEIVRNLSNGYIPYRMRDITGTPDEIPGEIPTYLVTDWEPVEISVTAIPADRKGAVMRSEQQEQKYSCVLETRAQPALEEVIPMIEQNTPAGEQQEVRTQPVPPVIETQAAAVAAPQSAQPTVEQRAQDAVTGERTRIMEIGKLARTFNLDTAFSDGLVTRGLSVDQARSAILDELATRSAATEIRGQAVVTRDANDTRKAAVEAALLHRADPAKYKLDDAAKQWRGMSLIEITRRYLEDNNVNTRGMGKHEVATLMFDERELQRRGMMTTSDLPGIFSNVANKSLRAGYTAIPQTFKEFSKKVTLSDFKASTRLQSGAVSGFQKVNEQGEFKYGSLKESGEKLALITAGIIHAFSRQAIVNDDMGALDDLPTKLGVQAANYESDTVWNLLILNPLMADGQPVFSAAHKNVKATSGAAPSIDGLSAGRTAMALQTDLDSKTVLNIRPTYIVVPTTLETGVEQLLFPVNAQTPSGVTPQFIQKLIPIGEPRLNAASATAWYLIASNGLIDTIEYAYLDGEEGVYIETKWGWNIDGMEIKARLDFGAAIVDYRGLYKNVGA